MSRALPGEHYCAKHQGNHSHYDPRNCTVCRLVAALRGIDTFFVFFDSWCPPGRGKGARQALRDVSALLRELDEASTPINRRLDIKAILADPEQRKVLIEGAVDFICKVEGIRP